MDKVEIDNDHLAQDITESDFFDVLELVETNERPTLSCDFSKFEKYFENSSLTEAQRIELLQTYWDLVISIIGYFNLGIHPIQQATNSCGQGAKHSSVSNGLLDTVKDSITNENDETQEGREESSPLRKGERDA